MSRKASRLVCLTTRRCIVLSEKDRSKKSQNPLMPARPGLCMRPNRKLQPVKILPLFPYFDRFEDQIVVATFDSAPTADSEIYGKLEKDVRDAHEAQAIMKSFVATGSDAAKPDKFLGYMVPAPNELSKDMYDETEDISYSWIRGVPLGWLSSFKVECPWFEEKQSGNESWAW